MADSSLPPVGERFNGYNLRRDLLSIEAHIFGEVAKRGFSDLGVSRHF